MPGKNTNNQQGFTIIEVLIVLAVAGLILMIVFQAIPTLQRNARNNERKQDVAALLESVSHFMLNNSGAMPEDCGGGGGQAECADTGGPLANTQLRNYQDAAAGTQVEVIIRTQTSGSATDQVNPNDVSKVAVYNFQHCDLDNPGRGTATAAGFRDVVALYAVESANNTPTTLCKEM
jgi:prepilin-type N-terminal cleavage/methylation domain-containing protein